MANPGRNLIAFCVTALLLMQRVGLAQQPPDGPPPDGVGMQEGPPPQAPPSPAQMLDRLHEQLGISDEQWPTISAKIQTMLQLEHELYAGPGGRPPGRPPERRGGEGGDPNGGPPNNGPHATANGDPFDPNAPPENPPTANGDTAATHPEIDSSADAVRKARRALGDMVHQPDATADEIHNALKTLRDARAAARTTLATAQAELKSMLTEPQQAMLLVMGILE